ncbi:MAG: hypothetical protein WBE69_19400 [Candidatus Binataceae bacterium]
MEPGTLAMPVVNPARGLFRTALTGVLSAHFGSLRWGLVAPL